ncbi:MAG: hypothetical protein ACI832_002596 [Rheinheimera aquimaris]|jgi:hypothetical protein|tara:strand:- start:3 stop:182 length:180 start_codon:yes stop_codon:yes gene_type:complete
MWNILTATVGSKLTTVSKYSQLNKDGAKLAANLAAGETAQLLLGTGGAGQQIFGSLIDR